MEGYSKHLKKIFRKATAWNASQSCVLRLPTERFGEKISNSKIYFQT